MQWRVRRRLLWFAFCLSLLVEFLHRRQEFRVICEICADRVAAGTADRRFKIRVVNVYVEHMAPAPALKDSVHDTGAECNAFSVSPALYICAAPCDATDFGKKMSVRCLSVRIPENRECIHARVVARSRSEPLAISSTRIPIGLTDLAATVLARRQATLVPGQRAAPRRVQRRVRRHGESPRLVPSPLLRDFSKRPPAERAQALPVADVPAPSFAACSGSRRSFVRTHSVTL